jgi:hypothetical protein
MNKRCSSLIVAFMALLVCSCANEAEIAKLRAETEGARADAAEARAVAESLKAELAKDKADADAAKKDAVNTAARAKAELYVAKAKSLKDMAEIISRWNIVANGVPNELPPAWAMKGFRWEDNHFPHPTFKGGSAEAYGAFAKVLLAFFEQGDNFDFLASNQLFAVNLQSGVAGPSGPDAGWTFARLAQQFSQPGSYGSHDEATRKSLKGYSDRIQSQVKKNEGNKT